MRRTIASLACGIAVLGLVAAEPAVGQRRGRAPAAAAAPSNNVQRGIAAWRAGNYEDAVEAWRPSAELGDADAQFNLGQAFRLGRGVPQSNEQALVWFERAARQRHEQAGTNLGLLLFQQGQAREAMPWLQDAANRGDPRAQYVFGTALFNGDVLRRDLPRAYALMSMAAGQGFPQAADQLQAMERAMSPEELQSGRTLAAQMGAGAAPTRTAEATPPPAPTPEPRGRPGVSYDAPPPDGPPPPRYEPRVEPRPQPRPERPVRQAEARPAPPRRAPVERPTPAPARAASGNWQVQLGAFADEGNARRQWTRLRGRVGALGGVNAAFVRAGAVTRLRAGPFASREAAARVCTAARSAGADCIPIPR